MANSVELLVERGLVEPNLGLRGLHAEGENKVARRIDEWRGARELHANLCRVGVGSENEIIFELARSAVVDQIDPWIDIP